MDNPVYQGVGPRPHRGTPPPIIIYDMQAMERSRERNLHEARERVRKRLQEEAKQEERRLDPHLQRQSVHDHDQLTVGAEVLREQPIRNSHHSKSNCYTHENNILGQRNAEHHTVKVPALKSRFETPQEGQSQNKNKRHDFFPGTCDREGIYAQIDETLMMDVNLHNKQHETERLVCKPSHRNHCIFIL